MAIVQRAASNLNRGLTRLDALETVSKKPPIKRWLLPAVGIGLSASLLYNNYSRATSEVRRKKALTRDILVIGGTALGLLAGIRFAMSATAARLVKLISGWLGRPVNLEHMSLSKKAVQKLKAAGEFAKPHHHDDEIKTATSFGKRVGELFKSRLHQHGVPAFVTLESIALGSILGGGFSGVLADWFNREDLADTAPMKLKEGIFQFLGNITICTAAILGIATIGKAAGRQLVKNKLLRKATEQATVKKMRGLAEAGSGDLRRVPKDAMEKIETVLIQGREAGKEGLEKAADRIESVVRHTFDDRAGRELKDKIRPQLIMGDIGAVRKESHRFLSDRMAEELKPVLSARTVSDLPPAIRQDVKNIAEKRAENIGELAGVVLGLGTGILGGAWVSNQVNEYLTKKLGLPQGHTKVSLFGDSPGIGVGKLGDRGIHWWDAILHIDDWPSVLYLAGIKSLESLIYVLYGISGYLTGTAGTDYSQPERKPVDLSLFKNYAPLKRSIMIEQILAK